MAIFLQYFVVALAVLLAAAYVAAKYLPAAWRRRLAYLLTHRGANQSALARWLDTDATCGSGCGSCGSCALEQPAQPATGHRVIALHEQRVDTTASGPGHRAQGD